MKIPRLPEYPTLSEVADWLTEASTEDWSERCVLDRFLKWDSDETGERRSFPVETLFVVLRDADELLDVQNGFVPCYVSGAQRFELCVPVDSFILPLMEFGSAMPPTLRRADGHRFKFQHQIAMADIRLRREWVEQLLPTFDRLMFAVNSGEFPELIFEATALCENAVRCRATSTADAINDEVVLKKWEIPGRLEHQARQIGLVWMLRQETQPGVIAIAKQVEKELKNRNMTGPRGDYWDWQTIKREALTGITGRKVNGRK